MIEITAFVIKSFNINRYEGDKFEDQSVEVSSSELAAPSCHSPVPSGQSACGDSLTSSGPPPELPPASSGQSTALSGTSSNIVKNRFKPFKTPSVGSNDGLQKSFGTTLKAKGSQLKISVFNIIWKYV